MSTLNDRLDILFAKQADGGNMTFNDWVTLVFSVSLSRDLPPAYAEQMTRIYPRACEEFPDFFKLKKAG